MKKPLTLTVGNERLWEEYTAVAWVGDGNLAGLDLAKFGDFYGVACHHESRDPASQGDPLCHALNESCMGEPREPLDLEFPVCVDCPGNVTGFTLIDPVKDIEISPWLVMAASRSDPYCWLQLFLYSRVLLSFSWGKTRTFFIAGYLVKNRKLSICSNACCSGASNHIDFVGVPYFVPILQTTRESLLLTSLEKQRLIHVPLLALAFRWRLQPRCRCAFLPAKERITLIILPGMMTMRVHMKVTSTFASNRLRLLQQTTRVVLQMTLTTASNRLWLLQQTDTDEGDLTNNSFPFKLYRMLVKAKEDGKEIIVSFTPSGRAIQIHEPNECLRKSFPSSSNRIKSNPLLLSINLLLPLYSCSNDFSV
jgi:hypothetical protein